MLEGMLVLYKAGKLGFGHNKNIGLLLTLLPLISFFHAYSGLFAPTKIPAWHGLQFYISPFGENTSWGGGIIYGFSEHASCYQKCRTGNFGYKR